MLFHPALVLPVFSYAALSVALAPAPAEITAAPIDVAAVPVPELNYTLSCWCETIPYLTTTFCLPCSTVYFTTDWETTETTATPTLTATT
ncbi:hypothetical protein B0H12DRAFT_1111481 [Mycena haematopus]|nr:hypothetical protein B0H12DRAFT_1111481 [Mycena haematopus]